jgi:hypothetical protein
LTAYPPAHLWYFNPFAWQLLFVIGATLGYGRVAGRVLPLPARRLVRPAAVFVGIAAIINISWTIHGVYDPFPGLLLKPLWPISKTNLALFRVINFLALAILTMHFVPQNAAFLKSRLARPVIICGQQSLQVFCVSILLSVLGHFVLIELYGGLAMEIVVTLIGFALMISTAALLEWYRALDRGTARPRSWRLADRLGSKP